MGPEGEHSFDGAPRAAHRTRLAPLRFERPSRRLAVGKPTFVSDHSPEAIVAEPQHELMGDAPGRAGYEPDPMRGELRRQDRNREPKRGRKAHRARCLDEDLLA